MSSTSSAGPPRGRRWHVVALLTVVAAGCSPATREEGTRRPDSGQAAVALTPADRTQYEATVRDLRRQVVLVDFWATWCGPCVEQLPHTVDLARRLADRGLAVVAISFDEPAEADRVAEILRAVGAGSITNLLSQFGSSPRSMEEFDVPGGALPYYQIYDREGNLRHTFATNPAARQQFTLAEVDAAIEALLAE